MGLVFLHHRGVALVVGAVDVAIVEVLDSTVDTADAGAVAGDIAVEAPLVAQDARQQPVVHGVGLAAPCLTAAPAGAGGILLVEVGRQGVVRRHDALHAALLDRHLEGGQVILKQVVLRHKRRAALTALLVVVGGEVLGTGHGLQVFRVVALHALDELYGQLPGQEGVLAVVLLVAAPAGVTAHIDGGTPVVQVLTI